MKVNNTPTFVPHQETAAEKPTKIESGIKPVRRQRTMQEFDEQLKTAAKGYEKIFLRQMVQAMRGTVSENSLMPASQGEKIFREQLDEEYVEKWGDKGGIGLGDMVYKQMRQMVGMDRDLPAPRGPMAIGSKHQMEIHSPKKMTIKYELQQAAINEQPEQKEVTAPWSGSLVGARQINPDEYLLEMNHDNGLKSKMVFRGQLDSGLKNPEIQAGQRIGLLSREAKSFFWTVDSL